MGTNPTPTRAPDTPVQQRMDWLIFRRQRDPESSRPGETLVELWPVLPAVTIMELKSLSKGCRVVVRSLRSGDEGHDGPDET